ncbi:hypothetical protein ACKWTF_014336 [Chironomus riparius]
MKFKELKFSKFLSKISTIHGLSYIGDGKASRFSKLFWISAFICSFLGCFFFFLQVYEKVFVVPDISIKIDHRPLNEFPFPAITICPQNKFPYESINYNQNLDKLRNFINMTETEKEEMELAFQSCQSHLGFVGSDLKFNYSCAKLVEKLSEKQFQDEILLNGHWEFDKSDYLKDYINRVLTFDGFCFTFNQLNFNEIFTNQIHEDFEVYKHKYSSNWSVTSGYLTSNSNYPFKMQENKKSVLIWLEPNDTKIDKFCSNYQRGFQIFWHSPGEILTPWIPSININSVNRKFQIFLKVKSFKMSPELQKYNVKYRQCYFDGEKKLKFFKIYTEKNCKFECLANITLSKCGCVRYYMPRDNITRICQSIHLPCVNRAYNTFINDHQQCNCLTACNYVEYELISIEKSKIFSEYLQMMNDKVVYTFKNFFKMAYPNFTQNEANRMIENLLENIESHEDGFVKVNKQTLKVSKRPNITYLNPIIMKGNVEERTSFSAYQMQQFISDFGGLLSLAMGCSILSIVEIIYNAFNVKNEPEPEDEKDKDEEKVEENN